jgi:hypothetical protein
MMKRILMICLTVSLLAAIPAFAQQPNPQAEAEWQHYLSKHPGLAEHPEWLENPTYLKDHPNMTKWLHDHPAVAQQAREAGMWDKQGQWHEASWWREHHPNQANQYHPDWAQQHPEWEQQHPGWNPNVQAHNEGAMDEHHQWQQKEWWVEHHPNWVKEHHPGWMAH